MVFMNISVRFRLFRRSECIQIHLKVTQNVILSNSTKYHSGTKLYDLRGHFNFCFKHIWDMEYFQTLKTCVAHFALPGGKAVPLGVVRRGGGGPRWGNFTMSGASNQIRRSNKRYASHATRMDNINRTACNESSRHFYASPHSWLLVQSYLMVSSTVSKRLSLSVFASFFSFSWISPPFLVRQSWVWAV